MTILTTTITIGIHYKAQFVTPWVCKEQWTEAVVIATFAFGEICECELTYRLIGITVVLPGWGLVKESSGVHGNIHLQSQAVANQVFSACGYVVNEVSMRDEVWAAMTNYCLLVHQMEGACAVFIGVSVETNCSYVVGLVFSPIQIQKYLCHFHHHWNTPSDRTCILLCGCRMGPHFVSFFLQEVCYGEHHWW